MMDTQRDRHTIEYEIIPEYMYSDKATDFVNTILIKKHYLILEMYRRINADVHGYTCPYTEKDFDVDAIIVGNIAGIMRIHMPAPLHSGDIIRMYICHDVELGRVRLYTVRVDDDNDTCFMTWVDDSHYINHGKFKLSERDEMKTVMNFYMKYLSEDEK
ncbi:hypothetical protein [Butyrivibrio sp. MB2005]|uniref:hypothetical protein n=1 Tax=Butyrivibrio sp. MB2005 TaxID=1280678 RepID=UPI0003F977B9|nr:hypothetical protein [Butyrivibrio sp. MB2005]